MKYVQDTHLWDVAIWSHTWKVSGSFFNPSVLSSVPDQFSTTERLETKSRGHVEYLTRLAARQVQVNNETLEPRAPSTNPWIIL